MHHQDDDPGTVSLLRSPLIAAAIDALCLVVFVVAGREQHDLGGGLGWFFTVLWPLAAGWFAVALLLGVYRRPPRVTVRLALTIAAGIGIGLVLRAALTQRSTPVAFVIVAFCFVALTTVG